MSTDHSTGTVRGSEHPAVAELIRYETFNWFGTREPSAEDHEIISSEALAAMLVRTADLAFNAGRSTADPDHGADDILRDCDNETALCQINALFSALDALANDHESQFDRESARWLIILGRSLVRRLLPQADE